MVCAVFPDPSSLREKLRVGCYLGTHCNKKTKGAYEDENAFNTAGVGMDLHFLLSISVKLFT